MKIPIRLSAAAILMAMPVLTCSLSALAQERGYWRAASSNAEAITSDVAISNTKISINLTSFTIAQIRKLQPAEINAAFDADIGAGGSGNLYRLNVPAGQRFAHHNTLCGSDDTEWMATYVQGRNLQIAFFSGSSMPVLTPDALANSTNVCGAYSYVR